MEWAPQQHGHQHDHGHTYGMAREALRLGFLLTVGILLIEVIGALLSGSLALLSDAAHVLTDAFALGLAWFAAAQAARPADEHRTFGYHRVGILTALANGATLIVIAIVIAFEAFDRLRSPQPVTPAVMIGAALVAIAVNLYIGYGLRHEAAHNLNARAAALHVVGDIGASAGVVIGAVVILFTGAYWVDPLVSVLIALLIAVGAVRVIREATGILLESAPKGLSLPALVRDMCRVAGIQSVHDLHVWTIASGMRALSCHAVIADLPPSGSAPILDRVTAMLRDRYGIGHTTIQFESKAHASHDGFCACPPGTCDTLYCELHPEDERAPDEQHAPSA
ncbi:MAG TPA: cation diffusion facilitator family transporter [Ktedonobacterales bacterium]